MLKLWYLCPEKPLSPCDFRASECKEDSITLSWNAPESDGGSAIKRYMLEKSEDNGNTFSFLQSVDSYTLSTIIRGLSQNKSYMFRIRSENVVGTSDSYAETQGLTKKAKSKYLIF